MYVVDLSLYNVVPILRAVQTSVKPIPTNTVSNFSGNNSATVELLHEGHVVTIMSENLKCLVGGKRTSLGRTLFFPVPVDSPLLPLHLLPLP